MHRFTFYVFAIVAPTCACAIIAHSTDNDAQVPRVPTDAATSIPVVDSAKIITTVDASECKSPSHQAKCNGGFCEIPPGCFIMGSPRDELGHAASADVQVEVTLTHSFFMADHETTQGEWTEVGFNNPSTTFAAGTYEFDNKIKGDCIANNCPVGNVSWFEALAFANSMSSKHSLPECYKLINCDGKPGKDFKCTNAELTSSTLSLYDCPGYRLPTEAEWEYSMRAGTTTAFYSGTIAPQANQYDCFKDPNADKIAWYCANSNGSTHPVKGKLPNVWGLFDGSGNATELVHDHLKQLGYGTGPLIDPGGKIEQYMDRFDRVTRGGLYLDPASGVRSASMLWADWNSRGPGGGFRLARTADRTQTN